MTFTQPMKEFFKIDLSTLLFFFIYPLIMQLLGSPITFQDQITVTFFYWILSLLVYGFMGRFKAK